MTLKYSSITNTWSTGIASGSSDTGYYYYIGTGITTAPIAPFQKLGLNYKIGKDTYSYADRDDYIKVDKGSPAKARYAVFYAVNKDPVIFCRTRREMIKEVKKLLKRKEVDIKSIRIFALVGGAKIVKK